MNANIVRARHANAEFGAGHSSPFHFLERRMRVQSVSMPDDPLLDTSTVDLSELYSNGLSYQVPPYQRDYAWEEDHWEDLWQDIEELSKAGSQHYMGAIVLQRGTERRLTIIDGQQRLATLGIVALVLLKRIRALVEQGSEPLENEERFRLLFGQFVGARDPASLAYSSKLELNETDDGFYQGVLVQLKEPLNPRKLGASEKRLWSAFRFFEARVGEVLPPGTQGQQLAEFLYDKVARRLVFIRIVVQNALSAYTVFETLNARGLELSAPDLLKNYLLSKVASGATDLDLAHQQWNRIAARIGPEQLTEFIRHYTNTRFQPYVRRERLFKKIRDEVVRSREDVFSFLDELERASYAYAALDDPNDEFWLDFPRASEQVRTLRLFRVTQYKPLALAAILSMKPTETADVLRACVAVSFRFNIIGRRSTHQLEDVYNRVAVEVVGGRCQRIRDVLNQLKPVYIDDEEFANDFSLATVETTSRNRLAKYILSQLERQIGGIDNDFETGNFTVEHILPEALVDDWREFTPLEHERMSYRIGNLTLLEPGLNREAGSKPMHVKRPLYQRSQFEITRRIQNEEWTAAAIDQRQKQMAKWATAIWKLSI